VRPDKPLYSKMLRRTALISALSGLILLSAVTQAASVPYSLLESSNTANQTQHTPARLALGLPHLGIKPKPHQQNIYSISGDIDTPAPHSGDKAGLIKDTKYFFAYQVTIVGLLYISPQSFSGWSDEQKDEFSFDKYKNNVRHAVWDSDQWDINYIMHPYWGSAYYVRARERGYDENAAFWYSAALSASFEFGFEAFFEEPSLQDIIVTPVAGAFLGMYFMKLRKEIRARHASGEEESWGDAWIMALTDPLGAMNAKTEEWFGDDEQSTQLSPVMVLPAYRATDFDASLDNRYRRTQIPVLGVQYSYRW